MEYAAYFQSPIGAIEITSTATDIVGLYFVDEAKVNSKKQPKMLQKCLRQLQQYFAGERKNFSLSLAPQGTAFQKTVWHHLQQIPFAKTTTYKDIAETLGKPQGMRAVGNANGRNRISIVIPCHRVVGSNQHLTGYAGGLWRKKWLLQHEGVLPK